MVLAMILENHSPLRSQLRCAVGQVLDLIYLFYIFIFIFLYLPYQNRGCVFRWNDDGKRKKK